MKVIFESSTNQRLILPDAPLGSSVSDLADLLNTLLGGLETPIQASQLEAIGIKADSREGSKSFDASSSLIDQFASLEVVVKSSVPFGKSLLPRGGTSILFAGQGTDVGRFVASLLSGASPEGQTAARKLFSRASAVLGYDLLDICLKQSAKLDSTLYSQPAIVVASLAAVECAKADKWAPLKDVKHVAGFSLGEYSALIYAGAVSFEDGIRLIHTRAQAMDEEARLTKGSMITVMGLGDEELQDLCCAAESAGVSSQGGGDKPTIQIANHLFPKARVLSGDAQLVKWVAANATKNGALMAKELSVAGAFHSPYMLGARAKLKDALANVTMTLPTKVSISSNVTAEPYTSVADIKSLLEEQLVAPVRWEQSIVNMRTKLEVNKFIDAGPGIQLKSMMRRIDAKVFADTMVLGK